MAKLTIVLDKRTQNAQGTFPIKIQVCNGSRSATSVSTKIYVPENVFIGSPDRAVANSCPNATAINKRVQRMYLDYMNAITEMEYEGKLQRATAASIKEFVNRNSNLEPETTFSSEMNKYISTCRAEKTKRGYEYARDTLCQFMRKNTIYFDELDYTTIVAFDRWLERQRNLSINSRGVIFRYIRSIFNAAIKADKISPNDYPFRKFVIKKAQKEKEFLTLDEMRAIRNLDMNGMRRTARDFFMLSFYLCGVNPIDLFNFPKPDKKGNLVFVRHKIAHTEPTPIRLHIQPEAQEIIDRYAGKDHLLYFAERYEFETFRRRLIRYLSYISEAIDRHVYFYMARYTWATFADNIGISHDVISKALGHSDKSTAERYYISFNWDRANSANREVINYLNGN